MTEPRLVIFDDRSGAWGPMTELRPVFELRSGALTTRQRIEHHLGRRADALLTPPALAALAGELAPGVAINPAPTPGAWLLVNGRCAASDALQAIARLIPGQTLLQPDGQLLAACWRVTEDAREWIVPTQSLVHTTAARVLLERPWSLLEQLEANLTADVLALDLPVVRPQPPVLAFGEHPLKLHPSVKLQPGCVLNTEAGPIALDQDVVVAATAVLEGPCYLGAGTRVAPGAHLRPPLAVGPGCKLGGEISTVIVQGYSNKSHYGYLGHAVLGQFVNLGAGTVVSNLKNTYGSVRARLSANAASEDTGRQFFGGILGDFVRTAIGSRLSTGSVIGTASMVALSSFCPTFVDSFRFVTDSGDQTYRLEKLLETLSVMLGRREHQLTPALTARLRQLARGDEEQPQLFTADRPRWQAWRWSDARHGAGDSSGNAGTSRTA